MIDPYPNPQCGTCRRSVVYGLFLGLLAAAGWSPLDAQAVERGLFVVRQRNDTLAVERFSRTDTHLESAALVRDRPDSQFMSIELLPDGRVGTLEWRVGSVAAPVQRATLRFEPDTLVWLSPSSPPFKLATTHHVMPRSILSVLLLEQMVHRARVIGGDSVDIPIFIAQDVPEV